MTSLPTAIFIPISHNEAKLQVIVKMARYCLDRSIPLLYSVPSKEAAEYIDTLLWRLPEESFIPHAILSSSSKELIGITTSFNNHNNASILFNLRPEPHPLVVTVPTTYELFDQTLPEKQKLSEKKKQAYLSQNILVK